jgi:hypothetical protein
MTWGGEVAHIMRKDARELRWVIGGYLTVVLFGTVNALGWLGTRHSFEGGMLLVVATGMLLLASLVQADSPTRPDAFWASHPHRPLAVMFAKLVLAAIVIVVPALVGQYAALSVLAVTGATAARLLGAAMLIYAAWLLATLVISAITPDIRTFILVLIATPIALILAANLFIPKAPTMSMSAGAGVGTAAFLAALIFVAVLYRTRDTRRRTWIVAFLVVACTAYTVVAASPDTTVVADPLSSPAHKAALHFERGPLGHVPGGNATILEVRVAVDSAPHGERIEFTPTIATIQLVDGKHFSVSIHNGSMLVTEPDVPVGGGISLSPRAQAPGRISVFTLQLPAEQSALATKDVSSVTVEGNIISTAATIVGSLALERGATAVRPGIRVDVDEVRTPPNAQVELHVRAISNGATLLSDLSGRSLLDAVLVDETHRTAQLLFPLGSQGTSGAMVLPASEVHNEVMQFGTAPAGEARPLPTPDGTSSSSTGALAASANANLDPTWLRTHRLTVLQWVKRGDYPVSGIARPMQEVGTVQPSANLRRARAR